MHRGRSELYNSTVFKHWTAASMLVLKNKPSSELLNVFSRRERKPLTTIATVSVTVVSLPDGYIAVNPALIQGLHSGTHHIVSNQPF